MSTRSNGKGIVMARRRKSSPIEIEEPKDERSIELDAIKQSVGYRRMRTANILIVLVTCFALLGGLLGYMARADVDRLGADMDERIASISDEKPGRQTAIDSVWAWLTSKSNAPFPQGVENLMWSGGEKVGSHADPQTGETTDVWKHTITFTDKAAQQTRAVTQIVEVVSGQSTAVGVPSILPPSNEGKADGATLSKPDGYSSMENMQNLSDMIAQWAKAYVGSDSTALTVLVGDPDTSHAYQAARLGKYQQSTIGWAVYTDEHGGATDTGTGYAAVSVTIDFTPTGGKSTSHASTSMLLLVRDPGAGSAKIVDWGADGDPAGLSPYRLAVAKTSSDAAPSESPSPTDTESDTAGASDTQTTDGESGDTASTTIR